MAFDDHHRGVDAGELHGRVEDAVHDLLEIDGAAELAEQPISASLPLGTVERLGEIVRELVHLAPHLVDGTHQLRALRGRRSTASPEREEDHYRRQPGSGDENHRSCRHNEPFLLAALCPQ